ncbi:unnamed protein product [Gulo gulo]|uniref:Uncharacterized protein n=1 Tax=Gulo gulo TaxID=48420 RepID=A0A9X9PT08_GULGU|nr:unnamed protein product [Gulo gulo]
MCQAKEERGKTKAQPVRKMWLQDFRWHCLWDNKVGVKCTPTESQRALSTERQDLLSPWLQKGSI